jgi:6-phosphofructokinase 1
MGRSAGHLALGMAIAGGASCCIIPEEFQEREIRLADVCEFVERAMDAAQRHGMEHGVALIAEGVGDLLKDELTERFAGNSLVTFAKDEFGHIRLAELPFGLIVKRELQDRAKARGETVALVDVTIGYELRCADPVPFDVEYTHALGWGAVEYLCDQQCLDWPANGALISMQEGRLCPIAFADIMDVKTGRTAVRRADLCSDQYRSVRDLLGHSDSS